MLEKQRKHFFDLVKSILISCIYKKEYYQKIRVPYAYLHLRHKETVSKGFEKTREEESNELYFLTPNIKCLKRNTSKCK